MTTGDPMTAIERLNLSYMSSLFSTPEGRAHVLAQAVDGESSGESAIFGSALAGVDDPELQRVIRKHRDDELRHEQLFRARLEQQGAPYALPEDLRFVARFDRALGGIIDRPVRGPRDVLEAYTFLQVLEERAVASFALMARAMRPHDTATAAVFEEVLGDEKRHLKYCVAVARKVAASEEERLEVLERLRAAEARTFHENQMANMDYTLARGWLGGPVRSSAWRALRLLARTFPVRPRAASMRLAYS